MAAKGIKVKALAQELGTTSRAVIDVCRENGYFVQNSITRLDTQLERMVRAWLTQTGDKPAGVDGQHSPS